MVTNGNDDYQVLNTILLDQRCNQHQYFPSKIMLIQISGGKYVINWFGASFKYMSNEVKTVKFGIFGLRNSGFWSSRTVVMRINHYCEVVMTIKLRVPSPIVGSINNKGICRGRRLFLASIYMLFKPFLEKTTTWDFVWISPFFIHNCCFRPISPLPHCSRFISSSFF